MSYEPKVIKRPIKGDPRYYAPPAPPPYSEPTEVFNFNLGQSGTNPSPYNNRGEMLKKEQMQNMLRPEQISSESRLSGSEVHQIVFGLIVIVIIGVIIAVMYFTKAFQSSQNIYGDTSQCCNICVGSSKNGEGLLSCADCNGCKSCDNAGL